jgi:hypothetical protein
MATKYVCTPNGRNIPVQDGHKINQSIPFQGPSKFTQIWIFGFKICHLATLLGAKSFPKIPSVGISQLC